jgi:hypothetical protein
MKMKTVSTCLFTIVFITVKAQNTDIPNPASNLQTLASGSYVIAMDNSLQTNAAGDFNLKTYGLLVYLLNNNVKLKWSIKAGKAKDGIDFTAIAEQLKPSFVAGVSRDFKAGPFVINAADTSGISALVDAYYTANSLTGADRPKLYRLTATANNVDIRYDLTGFKPKAAILTDGGNQNIHIAYMTTASIPASNYATSAGTDLLVNCYTFASEPHNTNTGTAVNNAISAIKNFVLNGGNFLAQCEAVNNYENNPLGRFQTTLGITIANTNIGTTLNYPNPDLSFSQFDGVYNGSLGGSLKNWKIVGSPSNSEHDHATGTGANTSVIGASVSKMISGKGGLVFYLGNHSFTTTSVAGINGIRMYMDAFLTPANTCPALQSTTLPVKLTSFSGKNQGQVNKLEWVTEFNETARNFEVEKSFDGKDFTPCGLVWATNKTGSEEYSFSQYSSASKVFYRLKMTDEAGKDEYSKTISITTAGNGDEKYLTIMNPVKTNLVFDYYSTSKSMITTNVYNSTGSIIYSVKTNCIAGTNRMTIPADYINARGVYAIEVIDNNNLNRKVSKAIKL